MINYDSDDEFISLIDYEFDIKYYLHNIYDF